jgi:hypothetical protein
MAEKRAFITSSRPGDHQAPPPQEIEMKFSLLFIRARRRTPKPKPAASVADWTVRDWADLPVHHPRRD